MISFLLPFLTVVCFRLSACCNHLPEESTILDLEKVKYLEYLKSKEHNEEVLTLLNKYPGTRHKWAVEFLYLAARYGNHDLAVRILGKGVFLFKYEAFNYRFHRELFFSTLYPGYESLKPYRLWELQQFLQGARNYINEKSDLLQKDWSFLPDAETLCKSITTAAATTAGTKSPPSKAETYLFQLTLFHKELVKHGKAISEALRTSNSSLFRDYIVCSFQGQMFGILTSHYLELVFQSHPTLILDNACFIDTWFRPIDKRGFFFELINDDKMAEQFFKGILDFVLASTNDTDAALKQLFPYIAGSAWHGRYSYHRAIAHYRRTRNAAVENAAAKRAIGEEAAGKRVASKEVAAENPAPKTL